MTKYVRAKRVLGGNGLDLIEDGVVIIDGKRITRVDVFDKLELSTHTEVIDLGDTTILPGFVDPHGHLAVDAFKDEDPQMLYSDFEVLLRATQYMRADLRSGVTSMRCVGDRSFMDVVMRDKINEGIVPGPRLLVSGPGLTATNGFGDFVSNTVDGPEDIRKAVRRNIREGADLIKLFISGGGGSKRAMSWTSYYSPEEIQAAVDEAHRVEKRVAAHIHGGPGIKYAARAGVNTIEHAHYVDDSDCELLAEKGTWIVFTLGIIHYDGPEVQHHPGYSQHKDRIRRLEGENVQKARKHGVKITAGTDAMHGLIWFEAECLHNFGLSQKEAMLAITRWAAEACGLEQQVGTLEAGKLADLVAVRGNPLQDIRALKDVEFVMKDGDFINVH